MIRGERVTSVLSEFGPDDQDAVRQLILRGLEEHWGGIDDSLNRDLDDIASTYAHGRTVVARVGDDLVATGTIVPRASDVAEIVRMSVAPDQRRGGVGRKLVAELIATARQWQMDRVVLETQSSWTDVIAFYVACGFEITGERDGAFGADTWFERRLS